MPGRYAKTTTVSVSSSKVELENVLERYGADQFAYATEPALVRIQFRIKGLYVRLEMPMPLATDKGFRLTPTGQVAAEQTVQRQFQQACMQRWRALVLVTKAKLEAAEIGISSLEKEFLANAILPDGRTVYDATITQVKDAYLTGAQPLLLLESGR